MKKRRNILFAIAVIALGLLTAAAAMRWGTNQGPAIFMFLVGIGIISIAISDWRTGMVAAKGRDNRLISHSRDPISFWIWLTLEFAVGVGLSGFVVFKWLYLSAR